MTYSYDRREGRHRDVSWQTMTPRERLKEQKHRGNPRMSPGLRQELEELIKQESAFSGFADLERSMIQRGYLPTIRNKRLKMLLDAMGLPSFP